MCTNVRMYNYTCTNFTLNNYTYVHTYICNMYVQRYMYVRIITQLTGMFTIIIMYMYTRTCIYVHVLYTYICTEVCTYNTVTDDKGTYMYVLH